LVPTAENVRIADAPRAKRSRPWPAGLTASTARAAGQEPPPLPALGARRGRPARRPQRPRPLARKLDEAIWWMLTGDQPVAPKGAATVLTA
jgi:hypothetical protein